MDISLQKSITLRGNSLLTVRALRAVPPLRADFPLAALLRPSPARAAGFASAGWRASGASAAWSLAEYRSEIRARTRLSMEISEKEAIPSTEK